jgi:hypothetical protein
LKAFEPGSYVLAVEVKSRLGNGAAVTRQTGFTVE